MSPIGSRLAVAVLIAISAMIALDARAQAPTAPANYPPTTPQPNYPPSAPPAGYPQGYAPPQPVAAPRPNPLRSLFAGTLSAILQGVSGGVVAGVTQGVNGSVANWFDRRQRNAMATPQYAYPPQPAPAYPGAVTPQGYPAPQPAYGTQAPTYGAQPTAPDPYGTTNPYAAANPNGTTSQYPTDPNAATAGGYTPSSQASYPYNTTTQPVNPYGAAPQPAYGATSQPNGPYGATSQPANPYGATPQVAANVYGTPQANAAAYSSPQSYDWSATQVYDSRTGQMTSAQASGYSLAQPGAATVIVAGGAYDVVALGRDGVEMPVNAATHDFRTGDRFKVYFRPSLPGRLDVYNINAYGRETRIDSIDTPAGQLTTLGAYEFAGTKGSEALRFVLSPCTTQQLLVATRDIVNVGAGTPGGGLNIGACNAPTTRSVGTVKTRDIQKVGVDGTTSFALDPVSQAELASGQLAPREFTVYFHHR